MKAGLVIPTLNAGARWAEALEAVRKQTIVLTRMLVIDSSSTDQTVILAERAGFEVLRIARSEFSHGGTRQWAAELLEDCDVIVFLTQDAVVANDSSLEEIVAQFRDPRVAVAYGRQLPHRNATAIEAHARIFNYGAVTQVKDSTRVKEFGTKTFFCSNSFAAYRRSALMELGGFRRDLILAEDAEFAARAVEAGYANVYCASALALHSHDYGVSQQFRRYFDLGVFDATNTWLLQRFGTHSSEGWRFINSELSYLMHRAPWQIPRALLLTLGKALGYRLGRIERCLPRAIKSLLSASPNYWRQI